MKASAHLREASAFDPEEVELMADVLDQAWSDVGNRFTSVEEVEKARCRMAQVIVGFAQVGFLEFNQLYEVAVRSIAC